MIKQIIAFIATISGIVGGIASWYALPSNNLKTVLLTLSIIVFVLGLVYLICKRPKKIIPYIQRLDIPLKLKDEIKNSSEVWIAWHSGSVNYVEGGLFEDNRKYKIILTKPGSNAVKELGKVANIDADTLNLNINAFTQAINKRYRDAIKWFDGFVGSSMIISDPEKESAWIRIEAFIPYLEAGYRPSVKFYKKYNEEEFNRFKGLFNDMWKNSETPEE